MATTLVLGAGFGGLAVATELRRALGDRHRVVLVDKSRQFAMGLRKLWALVGIGTLEEGSRSRELLNGGGVEFLLRRIDQIDPEHRRVSTDAGPLAGDYLVVALGAESRPDLVAGLTEHAHDIWDAKGVPALRAELERLREGRIAIVIAGVPYSCPPAPYECAMLLDHYLHERGVRARVELSVTTMQPMLLPNAGKAGSDWLAAALARRDIEHRVGRKVERFEPRRAVFSDGALEADILIAVPPHRVPAVVEESGLTGEDQWIAVEPGTLATRYAHVYAIGDVTTIALANGLSLPKAGIMAELEGQRVAAAIAADVLGTPAPHPFDGRGFCFMEMGMDAAAMIRGDFFASPEPRVELQEPSADHAVEKRRFEADRLERWFGRDARPDGGPSGG
jgi:sulfide:quinone oxidoreductase